MSLILLKRIYNFAENLALEKFFVLASFLVGLLYVLLVPPFQNVDEPQHYYRVLGVLEQSVVQNNNGVVGANLAQKYIDYVEDYNYLIKNIDKKVDLNLYKKRYDENSAGFAVFSNTALYAPLSYLPCLAVSAVHKWLPVQFEFYLMRFLNLVAYVVLGYFVIKKMPVARSAVSVILLLPMSLSLGAAVTSDVMVIMCNFLWVAMLLDFAFKKEKVTKFNILWLFVLAGILAICKNYFFLIFLITLIPSNKYESKKSYYFTVIGVILFALTLSVWWGLRIKGLIIPLNPVANQFEQLNLILQNPVSYAWIFVKSLLIKLPRIIITMIGVLGWQDTRLDFVTYAIIPVLFVCSIFCSNDEGCELKKWQIILLSCVFSLSFFCVATFMYLSWSAVGASIIMGLNGKYFLPIMSVFAVFTSSLVRNKLDLSSEKKLKALNYLIITACLFSSVLSVLHRFYGLTPNLYYSV